MHVRLRSAKIGIGPTFHLFEHLIRHTTFFRRHKGDAIRTSSVFLVLGVLLARFAFAASIQGLTDIEKVRILRSVLVHFREPVRSAYSEEVFPGLGTLKVRVIHHAGSISTAVQSGIYDAKHLAENIIARPNPGVYKLLLGSGFAREHIDKRNRAMS